MQNTCIPIKELKNTAVFAQKIAQSTRPVTITKNGTEAFIVIKPSDYHAIQQDLAKLRLIEKLDVANAQYHNKDYVEGSSFIEAVDKSYGL